MCIAINKDEFTYCELNCNNVEHQHDINCACTQIIHAFHDAGAKYIGAGSVNIIGNTWME